MEMTETCFHEVAVVHRMEGQPGAGQEVLQNIEKATRH